MESCCKKANNFQLKSGTSPGLNGGPPTPSPRQSSNCGFRSPRVSLRWLKLFTETNIGGLGDFEPFLEDYGRNWGKDGKNLYHQIHSLDGLGLPFILTERLTFLIVFHKMYAPQTIKNCSEFDFSFFFFFFFFFFYLEKSLNFKIMVT